MKKLIIALFTFQFLLFTINCIAQKQGQERLDSLLTVLKNDNAHRLEMGKNSPPEDTNKVILLAELSFSYMNLNPAEEIKYGQQALTLSEKLNWKKGIAASYRAIGMYYMLKSDYPKSLENFFNAVKVGEESGDKKGLAKALGNIAVIYDDQANYPKALEFNLKALKIQEELRYKQGIANTTGNIGIIYLRIEDYPKALAYFLKALKMKEELGFKDGIALSLSNIGNLYQAQKKYPLALDYFNKSLKIEEEIGDKYGMANDLMNIGNIYEHLEEKDYEKALDYKFKAVKLAQEIGNNYLIAKGLSNIGGSYGRIADDTNKTSLTKLFAGNKTTALLRSKYYIDSARVLLKQIGDLHGLITNYNNLSEIQSELGNYKDALASHKLYTTTKDSVFNLEKDKKLTQIAMQYEFDKKEMAAKAEQEKKDIVQRNVRNSIIAGAAFLLLVLIGLIARYRYTQKANTKLELAYANLKNTQQQLIEAEKLAAFGTMATRMAHEIQNPLNFVNNFSELSEELIHEIVSIDNKNEREETAKSLLENLQKINHHGKRASSIVSQLQEHSNKGTVHEFFTTAV